jgi:membrane protein implicated in regulation of membrane protease activity
LVLPGIGTLALLPVLWTTVYPYPAWPVNLTPYIFIAVLLVGAGYMIWLERRRPGALQRGATKLVGRTTDAQGDVDWDAGASAGAAGAAGS